MQKRQQQTTCAGSQIEYPHRRLAVRNHIQHRLDQGFRIGTGIEGFFRDAEGKAPEFPAPQNLRHGAARRAGGHAAAESRRLFPMEHPLLAPEHGFRRHSQHMGRQQPSLVAGIADPGLPQLPCRLVQGPGQGQSAAHDNAANLAAWSSAVNASMTSSSPSPSMICSILCRVRLMRWSVTRPWEKL